MNRIFTLCLLILFFFNAKAQDLTPFDDNGYIGFKDNTGKVVIGAKNKYPRDFLDGPIIFKDGAKYGYVDITGKIIAPPVYEGAIKFYKGFAAVQLDKTVFIIDKNGKEIKKLKYNS